MSDEGLRRSYDRILAIRLDPERVDCPAPEAIEAMVRREGAEADRLRLLDHVMGCAHCAEEFELLRSVHRASGEH